MDRTPIGSSAGALLARLALAALFIPSGLGKLAGFAGLVGYIASKGVPLPALCAAIAVTAELGLGVLLLVGWKTRWAALALAGFVAVISPIFHNYWAMPAEQLTMQKLMFFKNVAIVGGLLLLGGVGAGRWGVDRQPMNI